MKNPHDPERERIAWLRWQVSDELASSIAPGLDQGSEAAKEVLVEWLIHDRAGLISHCLGAVGSTARQANIEPPTRAEIAYELELVAWCHKVDR